MALLSKTSPMPGQVLICDFGPDPDSIVPPGVMTGPLGVKPEIFKARPVVVLNSSSGTTTVVPFSTKAPRVIKGFHYRIPAGTYPFMDQQNDSWVKGDLVTVVSNQRLDQPFVGSARATVYVSAIDLKGVRTAVLHGLGLGRLIAHL